MGIARMKSAETKKGGSALLYQTAL